MQIECPKCQTFYDVRDSSLGTEGRKVRCIRCETVWFVGPPKTDAAAAPQAAPAAAAPEASGPPEAGGFQSEPAGHAETDRAAIPEPDRPGTEKPEAPDFAPPTPEAAQADGAVEIADAPSIVPPQEQDPPLADGRNAHGGTGAPISRRARLILERRHKASGFPMQAALVVVLAAAIAGLLIGRKHVVHYAPQTASLYEFIGLPVNLRGLAFANVKTLREIQDGTPILIVEGQIVSVSSQAVDVPRLRFAVRNDRGQEVYSWTALAGRSILAPGDSMDFRSRLAAPPVDGTDVVVRFFNRRDLAAGNK